MKSKNFTISVLLVWLSLSGVDCGGEEVYTYAAVRFTM